MSGISLAEKKFTRAIAIISANTQAAALIFIWDIGHAYELSCKCNVKQPGGTDGKVAALGVIVPERRKALHASV